MDYMQHRNAAEKMLADHNSLMSGICGHRRWIYELCELGMPRFGELATRLRDLRAALVPHFQDEEAFNAAQRESGQQAVLNNDLEKTHQDLLMRLDIMMKRLQSASLEFPGWHAAVAEVETLVTDICNHEDTEMDHLKKSMTPNPG